MKRVPLGEKGMKSLVQRKDQKKILQQRKEEEEVMHMREKREKLNELKRKKVQKQLKNLMKKYAGLNKMINKTDNKEELKVLDSHKKDLDKEYKKLHLQLTRLY